MELSEAARVMGAQVVGPADGAFTGVCTDTRRGAAGALFFALRGENADGHRFVADAFRLGARAVVVERTVDGAAGPQLIVPDALAALGALAGAWRRRFALPVVGVTGSVGKTSTRQMIACALRARLDVLANEANFNNEIGVPLTLLGLETRHRAAVIEMAMRGPGQIADLAAISGPTVGVITNIGLSHVEILGTREAIANAKGELLDELPPDGTAILNADDDMCPRLAARARCCVVTFGVRAPAGFRATDVAFGPGGEPSFRVNGTPITVPAPGVHHVANAAAACAVASILGIPAAEVAARLAEYEGPAMRMETADAPGGITVLNDAYNAAPDSMRAALDTLVLLAGPGRRTVAVLGDMRELGEFSRAAHRYVGELVGDHAVGLLVTVGAAAAEIARAAGLPAGRAASFDDTDAAAHAVPGLVQPGDVVLVKGSRAMGMERIVAGLTGEPAAGH